MKVHICDHLWTLGGSVLPNLYVSALEVFYLNWEHQIAVCPELPIETIDFFVWFVVCVGAILLEDASGADHPVSYFPVK